MSTEVSTGIRCGACQGRHETILDVRACNLSGVETFDGSPEQIDTFWPASGKLLSYVKSLLKQKDVSSLPSGRIRLVMIHSGFIPGLGTGEELTAAEAKWAIDAMKNLPSKAREEFGPTPSGPDPTKMSSWKDLHNEDREPKVTQDGMYKNPKTGQIFKVQWNRAGTKGERGDHLYAKRLIVEQKPERGEDGKISQPAIVKFVYTSGDIYKIRTEWRMSIEDAKAFGQLYGVCLRCGRTLTLEESIERAMGRICASAKNWGV